MIKYKFALPQENEYAIRGFKDDCRCNGEVIYSVSCSAALAALSALHQQQKVRQVRRNFTTHPL